MRRTALSRIMLSSSSRRRGGCLVGEPASCRRRQSQHPGAEHPISKPGTRLAAGSASPQGNSQELDTWDLVRNDMELSGYFGFWTLKPSSGTQCWTQGGRVPIQRQVPGATALAKTALKQLEDGRMQAQVFVYDVPGRRKLLGRGFTFNPNQLRQAGHRISNLIIEAVGGEPGIFNTRFAAVSRRSGNKEIVVFDVDGQNVRPVTRNGSINLQPAWSQDGTKLAFTSYRRGNRISTWLTWFAERPGLYRHAQASTAALPSIPTTSSWH